MKQKTIMTFVQMLAITFIIQGCGTTSAERTVEEKLTTAPPIASKQELAQIETDAISTAVGLSDVQKLKLNELRLSARKEAAQIDQQTFQLRSLLVKDLVSTNYDFKKSNEVKIIKSKMLKLEKSRFELLVGTLEKAQKILGHQAKEQEPLMNNFFERDFEGRRDF